MASTASRGKKRKITTTAPEPLEVSEELTMQIRTSSAADISAELTRHVPQLMKIATTSSNLKLTYIKALKDTASYIIAAWLNETLKKAGPTHSNIGAARLVETRLSVLEEENAAHRKELAKMAACAHECPRCSGLASEPDRTAREGRGDSERLAALERRIEEIGPSIIRAIEERFRGRHHSPEARRGTSHSATRHTTQTTSPPREQKNGEWKIVESKSSRRKKSKRRTTAGEAAKKGAKKGATTTPPARGQQPPTRTTGTPKSNIVAPKKGPAQTPKTAILSRTLRTSAVTVTLN